MTHSGLTHQIRQTHQRSPRNGTKIDTMLIHYQAGLNDDAVIDLMVSGRKQVSANYTISNEGRLTCVVDEDYRAWTSGSSTDGGKGAAWDRRAITIETENETGAPGWSISNAAFGMLAALLVDLRHRYNIVHVLGHRDLWIQYRASYPTSCPGAGTVDRVLSQAVGGSIPASPFTPGGPAGGVDFYYGLTKAAMLATQKALARLGRYSGDQDGDFATQSVSAFQQWLKDAGLLPADYVVDGRPGPLYGEALHDLADQHGYTGTHEGLPGNNVSAAIERWAATVAPSVPQVIQGPAGRDWSYWEPTGELARRVQRALSRRGRYNYPNGTARPADGIFGEYTRKGVQITLSVSGAFVGNIDGLIERGGCYGIQIYARDHGSYRGSVDGAPREASWAGFALGLERR